MLLGIPGFEHGGNMERQRLEDREINYVNLTIRCDPGCKMKHGEYSIEINAFIGVLDLSSYGGVDDISLIKEEIEEFMSKVEFPEDSFVCSVVLRESGEWEDVFWHKYYKVERYIIMEI